MRVDLWAWPPQVSFAKPIRANVLRQAGERRTLECHEPRPRRKPFLNLSKFHREHEKFYAQAPLKQALELQHASRIQKTLADRWSTAAPSPPKAGARYMGAEDLNDVSSIQHAGVLFMEGEGDPAELSEMKRKLAALAEDFERTGQWLAAAMESS